MGAPIPYLHTLQKDGSLANSGKSTGGASQYGTYFDAGTAVDLKQLTAPASFNGVDFRPDGLKMYVSGTTTNPEVHEYDLAEPWKVGGAVFVAKSTGADLQDLDDIHWSQDGTKLFAIEGTKVRQFPASTPWDITSVSNTYTHQLTAGVSDNFELVDGDSRLFVHDKSIGAPQHVVYSLTTPGDLSTAVLDYDIDTNALSVTGYVRKVLWVDNGNGFIGCKGRSSFAEVSYWSCSTPYDLRTAAYEQFGFGVAADADFGAYISPDGKVLAVMPRGTARGYVNTYHF